MSDVDKLVIQYNVTDARIAEIAEEFKNAEADTPEGYKSVVVGIRCTRELRVETETTRKELKSDALIYGRRVDSEAHRITDALLAIETPLKCLKEAVDSEKARLKREKEEARLEVERKKLEKERAEKEAEERKIRKAEEARLAEEREKLEVERKALEEQRLKQEEAELVAENRRKGEEAVRLRKIDEENAARQRKQDAQDKERREKRLEEDRERAEKQRIEDADQEQRRHDLLTAEREREARDKAEKEVEEKRLEEARIETERVELEQRRLAALPDLDQLRFYVRNLQAVKDPHIASPTGNAVLAQVGRKLDEAAKIVENFAEELK